MSFNAFEYFSQIAASLKLAKDNGYYPCRVSGLANMEDVVNSLTNRMAYFAIDDTNDGYTFRNGAGYFERKMYIIFILKKFPLKNMEKQSLALEECRQIYRAVVSRLIKDRAMLEQGTVYLDTSRISFHEMEGYAIAGTTGLYMTLTIDQPINLCYNADDWY